MKDNPRKYGTKYATECCTRTVSRGGPGWSRHLSGRWSKVQAPPDGAPGGYIAYPRVRALLCPPQSWTPPAAPSPKRPDQYRVRQSRPVPGNAVDGTSGHNSAILCPGAGS